jgi:tRNA uridine 5-carbamoylmethylation protein Kti12
VCKYEKWKKEMRLHELTDLNEGPNDPAIFKAIFTAGGPGSGKTFVVRNTALQSMGFKIVNSDKQFEYYLKQAGLESDAKTIYSPQGQEIRQKSVDVTDKIKSNYVMGRLGLVIDGTGKDYYKIATQKQELEKLGYECAMLFVNTNLSTAQKRNKERDRVLPKDVVKQMWNAVQENIGKFQRLFKESLFIIDNSDGIDVQQDLQTAYKILRSWANNLPNNSQAKAWLDSQTVKELKIIKPDPKDTLGKSRIDMPQIRDEDYKEFIEYMQKNGVKFVAKIIPARQLKPMQKDFSDAGIIKQLKKQMQKGAFKKPVIMSSDGYIIDGHHRWLVASNTGQDLNVNQVNLPAEELYSLAKNFSKVYYKDVYERGSITVPTSGGPISVFPYRPLKIKKSTPGKLNYGDYK